MATFDRRLEGLLRASAPQVLGALVRRYGHFDACEDAVQEALVAASSQWPAQGEPDDPRAWLITVASRRLTDRLRSDSARRTREDVDAMLGSRVTGEAASDPADDRAGDRDDTLTLLFMCCHPALSVPSQLALTLRAVGGLTTSEIAKAFLVPEATMGQRISRAKQALKSADSPFRLPPDDEVAGRLRVVLHVLYLIFNEGYAASSGSDLLRTELTSEAIRLTRIVRCSLPADGEVAGLLALMLLTDARRATRTTVDGALVPLADQDRTRWDAALIDEGVALVTGSLTATMLGPYQLQAAIAAVHDEAVTAAETDWLQILALYDVLQRVAPNPVVTLNRSVAVAMVLGPEAALASIAMLDDDPRLREHYRLDAARAHFFEQAGDLDAAGASYRRAARRTTSIPEQRYLEACALQLGR